MKTERRFPWVIYFIVLFVIIAFTVAPIASVVIAGAVANANGCHVDEGSVHPCVIGGHDYGETLYTLGVLGWFMLLTLPAGGFAGLLWLVILIVHYSSRKRRQQTATVS